MIYQYRQAFYHKHLFRLHIINSNLREFDHRTRHTRIYDWTRVLHVLYR